MLMMHAPRGTGDYQVDNWPPEDIKAHIDFMKRFNKELTDAGELVGAEGLAAPGQARVVRAGKSGAPGSPTARSRGQGVPRRLLDRRRRAAGAGLRDRRPGLGGARARRRAAEHADRSAPGDERAARGPVTTASHRHPLRRAPAARPRAAGARRGRPPLRRFRRRRGRGAGGAARGRRAVAGEGVPDNPRGWLIQVAARRMTDHLRSEIARRRREDAVASRDAGPTSRAFVPPLGRRASTWSRTTRSSCCSCAATRRSRRPSAIALTLRAVGGLTTAEIANAFLVPEATMAQRISRAKQSIKTSGVPFRMPTDEERAERLGAVLHVLYLIFNEGYTSSVGPDLQRTDLSERGDPADAGRCTLCCRTTARSRACWR